MIRLPTGRPHPRVRGSRGMLSALAVALFAIIGPPLLGQTDVYGALTTSGILGISVAGLSLLTGVAGQVSLGQAGLVAVGAYASAIATVRWDLAPVAGIGLSVLACVVIATVTSTIIRLRGLHLALATLALGIVLQQVLVNLGGWTGGVRGLLGIPPLEIGGLSLSDEDQIFTTAWLLSAAAVLLNANMIRSRTGRALRAIHDDEEAARACGIPVVRLKIAIWLMSAAYTAVAGSLYAHYSGFIAPEQFGVEMSIVLVAAVVVGGIGSTPGALCGLVVLRLVPELIPSEHVAPKLLYGILLVVVMASAPGGLAGGASALAGRLRHRPRPKAASHA